MYSIGAIAKRTGLSPDTIRSWERRYKAVSPSRSDGGQRSYSEADARRIALLHDACGAGHSIARIAALSDGELRALVANERSTRSGAPLPDALSNSLLDAVARYDRADCEAVLGMAIATFPTPVFTDLVLMPVLRKTGERWHRGELSISNERMLSTCTRRVLLTALGHRRAGNHGRLLLGTLPGEQHDLGALTAAVEAADAGFEAHYVGAELPAAEFVRTAEYLSARAVLLSFTKRPISKSLLADTFALARDLPAACELWIAGAAGMAVAAEMPTIALSALSDFDSYRVRLAELASTGARAGKDFYARNEESRR